jgi:hypothetical protein
MSTSSTQSAPTAVTKTATDPEAGLSRFLMYTLSLPERVVRSTVGVTAGAAREAAHALVPQAFQSSKVYELVIASSLNFLTEDIGGVEQQTRPGEAPNVDQFLARKAVGNFVDLAGVATLHLSPIWVFAVVSDVAYGSKVYLNELASELRRRGLVREDSSITRVEDLLDALQSASGQTASLIATPPLSVAELKASVEKIRLTDPTALLPQQELAAQWNEMRQIATRENVSLLGVSGAQDRRRRRREHINRSRSGRRPLEPKGARPLYLGTARRPRAGFLPVGPGDIGSVSKSGLEQFRRCSSHLDVAGC